MSARRPLPRWADVVLLPVLNLVLALIVSGLVVLLIGQNPLAGHPDHDLRRLRLRRGHRLHAVLRHRLRLHRPRRGGRRPCRPVQHRRRGPGLCRRPRRDLRRPRCSTTLHWLLVAARSRSSPRRRRRGSGRFIPGYLQAKRGSHVVITTIMFNFIASALMVYLLVNVLKPHGRAGRRRRANVVAAGTHPAAAGSSSRSSATRRSTSRSSSPILALIVVYVLIWHTRFGYAHAHHGPQPDGVASMPASPTRRMIIIVMMISGALAGMVAVNEVLGVQTASSSTSPPGSASSASPWR